METIVHIENGVYQGQTRFANDLLKESLALSVKDVPGVASVGKKPYKDKVKDTGVKVSRCKDSSHLIIDINLSVLTGFSVSDVAYRVQEAVLNTATQFTKEKIDKVNIFVRGAKYGTSIKQK